MRELRYGRLSRIMFAAASLLFGLSGSALAAGPGCRVINLMPKFWEVVNKTASMPPDQQVRTFRRALVATKPSLYGGAGLGFESDQQLNAAILAALANGRDHQAAIRATTDLLMTHLPSYMARFEATFPDFVATFRSMSCLL